MNEIEKGTVYALWPWEKKKGVVREIYKSRIKLANMIKATS